MKGEIHALDHRVSERALGVFQEHLDLRQVDWLDAIGSLLFRLLCGAILLASIAVAGIGLWFKLFGKQSRQKRDEETGIGWGAILVFSVIGYFSWFGVVG